MTTTYRSTKRDEAVADDYLASHAKCTFCGSLAPHADIARFGARCQECYSAYCAEVNPSWWPNRTLSADERAKVIRKARRSLQALGSASKSPRAWAHALKAREDAGDRLTAPQASAWREALRFANPQPITEDMP